MQKWVVQVSYILKCLVNLKEGAGNFYLFIYFCSRFRQTASTMPYCVVLIQLLTLRNKMISGEFASEWWL